MSNHTRRYVIFALALLGCSSALDGSGLEESTGVAKQHLDIPKTASIPWPLQFDDVTHEPKLNPITNKPLSGWDGNYSQLVAADAYARCISEFGVVDAGLQIYFFQHSYHFAGIFAGGANGDQAVLGGLQQIEAPIQASQCPFAATGVLPNYPHMVWALSRSNPLCNVDPSTGLNAAAISPEPKLLANAATPPFSLVTWLLEKQYTNIAEAGDPMVVGYTSLCVAQRLNEVLEDSAAFSSTSDEHMYLLGTAHEQATVATNVLGRIVQIAARTDTPPGNVPARGGEILREWFDTSDDGPGTGGSWNVTVVRDYLRAVRLMTSLTTQFGSYLERQAGARWTTSATSDPYERDWGRDSARSRLMTMVFGGGPLWDAFTGNSSTGDVPVSPAWFSKVGQASDDPRVGVLLELARSANAIMFRDGSQDAAGYGGSQMYNEVEIYLRQRECQWNGQPCTHTDILNQLPAIENYSSYRLYNQYKITPDHANALAQSLFDAAKSSFSVTHVDGSDYPVGTFDLTGARRTTTTDSGLQLVTVESNTQLLPFKFEDWAQRSYYGLAATDDATGLPLGGNEATWEQVYTRHDGEHLHATQLGAFPSLAFARRVLFDLSRVGIGDAALQQTEADVLSEVERLTGRTTIVKSASGVTVIQPSTAPEWKLLTPAAGANAENHAVIVSPVDVRGASRDPSYRGIPNVSPSYPTGFTRANLDALADASMLIPKSSTPPPESLGLTKVEWGDNRWPNCSVVLHSTGADRSVPAYVYLGSRDTSGNPWESAVGIEGWLVDLVSRVTAVQDTNWSRPRYDGFGLDQKWVPPADASLLGGTAGQESYSYLLQSAKTAAEEATSAVQTAINGLSEQARDDSALQQAETKASQAAQQDQTALCGRGSCDLETVTKDFRWNLGDYDSFLASSEGTKPCKTERNALNSLAQDLCFMVASSFESEVLPAKLQLPKIVVDALANAEASFSGNDGSELQRVLLRQWNAARALLAARDQLGELAVSYGLETQAAAAATDAEEQTYIQALRNNEFKKDQLALSLAQFDLQATDVSNNLNTAQDAVNAANYYAHAFCDLDTRVNAICYNQHVTYEHAPCDGNVGEDCNYPRAVYDWPSIAQCQAQMGLANQNALVDDAVYCTGNTCGRKQGDGDTDLAANMRCKEACVQLIAATNRRQDSSIANQLAKKVTDAELKVQNSGLYEAVAAERAASDRYAAQVKQASARNQQAYAQLTAQFAVVRQVVGEMLLSLAEYDSFSLKLGLSASRAKLETDLADENWGTNGTNMRLRRKYRSYDMWRARALLESARRLAVTARRAIEARYVVDLSTLTADQPFVASPSTWADEVFESDLNAPAVVGLSFAPQIDNTKIYPNKLVDYVGNLERFVQGYAVAYPTSISLPDTEVVSISGPDRLATSTDGSISYLSPDTAGWRFYCANTGTWISHPGVGQYPIATNSRLATACNGQPPNKALYAFWLDPWGVKEGAYSSPPYNDRHNVRWRRLAVNLVGTGIRDCSKAADSSDCYTNPFVRFDLTHAGPSWQTNYSSDWRSLDTPTARIEAGKALAAEEWLEPVTTSWNMAYVSNVARGELFGRPMAGNYELTFDITPDTRLDRLERVQLLVEEDYWVRQGNSSTINNSGYGGASSSSGGATSTGGSTGSGGATSTGGSTGTGGSSGTGGSTSTGVSLTGVCTPTTDADRRIEDFEDFDGRIGTWGQRLGMWYGFHAGTTCAATPPLLTPLVPVPGYQIYSYGVWVGQASGTACNIPGNWAGGGIGFNFLSAWVNGVETICSNYDAHLYSGVAFDANGSGTLRVEVCTSDLTDANCHGYNLALTSSWAHYSYTWGQLAQESWGENRNVVFQSAHLRKIQFRQATETYGFSVDNVMFTN